MENRSFFYMLVGAQVCTSSSALFYWDNSTEALIAEKQQAKERVAYDISLRVLLLF